MFEQLEALYEGTPGIAFCTIEVGGLGCFVSNGHVIIASFNRRVPLRPNFLFGLKEGFIVILDQYWSVSLTVFPLRS